MKAVQVMMDERLLAELDACAEAKKNGRSALLRKAVSDFLRRRRGQSVDAQYRHAYGKNHGADPELEGWEEEQVWPE